MGTRSNPYLFSFRAVSIGLLLAMASTTHAATDEAIIDELRAQIDALTERLASLESKQNVRIDTYNTPQSTAPVAPSASWTDTIKLKGDFRYRSESFWIDNRKDRHRQRVRARPEMTAKVTDTVTVGFGLATGGDDPISSNQTLGGGASSKNISMDLAYAKWNTPVEGLDLLAGKFKNQFYRAGGSGLLWDGDVRPEGVGFTYKRDNLFASGLLEALDEDANGEDAFVIGAQIGVDQAIGDGALKAGVGYYNFTGAKGREPFFDGDPRGNLVNPDGTYLSDFELVDLFAEYAFAVAKSKITVFANYVNNMGADDYDTGYAFGAEIKQNRWSAGWEYRDLEADAVLGTLTDSDFIGGGTDGRGHILQVGYSLTKQISLDGTLFLNDRNVDFGDEEDFKRLMLDISFKY